MVLAARQGPAGSAGQAAGMLMLLLQAHDLAASTGAVMGDVGLPFPG